MGTWIKGLMILLIKLEKDNQVIKNKQVKNNIQSFMRPTIQILLNN